MEIWEALLRLAISVAIGAAIGIEREVYGRFAGLRTHIIVSVGACLIMLTSDFLILKGYTTDISRMSAQVISGIGFLGAGVILKSKFNIKGLTTAASVWTTACIGIAAGAGYYLGAIIVGAIVCVFLVIVHIFDSKLLRCDRNVNIRFLIRRHDDQLAQVLSIFQTYHIAINDIITTPINEQDIRVHTSVDIPLRHNKKALYIKMLSIGGVEIEEFPEYK